MNPLILIRNFRIFDDNNGAVFELAPMTILTGCNSSGKSSFVKALFLFKSFIDQVANDIKLDMPLDLSNFKLNFNKYPNNLLGRYERITHIGSGNSKVTIEYSIYSLLLSRNIFVKLVFAPDSNSDLNDAYLEALYIYTLNNEVIFSSGNACDCYFNYNLIKNECCDFIKLENLIHLYCSVDYDYNVLSRINKEEFDSFCNLFKELTKDTSSKRMTDILDYVRYSSAKVPICNMENAKDVNNIISWTNKYNSLFNIPIIKYLDTIEKEQFSKILNSKFGSIYNNAELMASQKIINDFVKSPHVCFSDYFKKYESSYLENLRISVLTPTHKRVTVPPIQSDIPQDYINYYYNIEASTLYVLKRNISKDSCDVVIPTQEQKKTEEQEKTNKFNTWKNEPINFSMIYEIVMMWNKSFCNDDDVFFYTYSDDLHNDKYIHKMFSWLSRFGTRLVFEAITPSWTKNMTYVGSSRAEVNRIYSLDSKSDFTMLLYKYIDSKRAFRRGLIGNKNYEIDSFLNKWIQKFELGYKVTFNVDEEGLGVKILIHKNENDIKGSSLADEGYGIIQLVSILIQIESAILNSKNLNINTFYGLDDLDGHKDYVYEYEPQTISIEEPEVHLHPSMQSMLAEMFYDAYKSYNIRFIIETHSEYLIRKFQTFVYNSKHNASKKEVKGKGTLPTMSNDDIALYYLSSPKSVKETNEPQVKKIRIKEDGCLETSFGPGFFDEADKLSLALFGI